MKAGGGGKCWGKIDPLDNDTSTLLKEDLDSVCVCVWRGELVAVLRVLCSLQLLCSVGELRELP